MKIKLDIDIEKDEISALKSLLGNLVQSISDAEEWEDSDSSDSEDSEEQVPDLEVIENHRKEVTDNVDFEDYKNSFEMHQSHLGVRKTLPTSFTPHQLRGKEIFADLINEWEVNFADEDAEQPDRLQLMHNLGNDGRKAGGVISYCMAVGGLTQAVHVIREENAADADGDFSRIIAANICQLASLILAPLADLYEFANPLTYEME
jgi:hypothetical protein